jgi:hypothetical protein
MSVILTALGKQQVLSLLVNKTTGYGLTLHLFKNDYTPVESSVTADFTEATFSGYASKTLTNSSWTITSSSPYYAYYANQTWTFTGNPVTYQTVYGYYIKQGTTNYTIVAERFTTAISLYYYNETLTIGPKIYIK